MACVKPADLLEDPMSGRTGSSTHPSPPTKARATWTASRSPAKLPPYLDVELVNQGEYRSLGEYLDLPFLRPVDAPPLLYAFYASSL